MKFAILASILGASAAFAPASQGASKATTVLNAEKSPAMPFLPYPVNCKGYIGEETGFDPLGFSNYFPMDYLREAELKHGRIAMLAIVGFITTDVGVVVHPLGQGLSSVAAHNVLVENKVMGNALIWIALAEIVSYIGVSEMLQGSGRAPGDFNFGTKYLQGKSEAQINKLKYQELKNGRLAMMAFSGAVTQAVLYDKGFPYF